MEEENKKELIKLLGLKDSGLVSRNTEPSWAEIFAEIGRLKERAEKPADIHYYPNPVIPLTTSHPNLHYHNGSPCYNNPCVWC